MQRRRILNALWVVLVVACHHAGANDDVDAGDDPRVADIDAAEPVDTGIDIGPDTDPVACATSDVGSIWGHLYDQESRIPLANVGVCILNQPAIPCVSTDRNGVYAIPCVPSGDAELEYRGEGYPRELWAWSSRYGINEDVNLGLLALTNYGRFLTPSGQHWPDGMRALVTLYFVGDLVDGTTVALSRGTGAGPYYTRYQGGTLDPSVQAVADHHENAYFFAQAPAGEQEVQITVTPGPHATRCTQYYGGWAGSTAGSIRIPVAPDVISVLFIICE